MRGSPLALGQKVWQRMLDHAAEETFNRRRL
jgi:hypothetical protein